MARATLTVIPLIIIFFLAQRFFVEGKTITGIKAQTKGKRDEEKTNC